MPSEISIRGRTTYWFTYTVQKVKFELDGFDGENRTIYAGYQKKMFKFRGKNWFVDEKGDNRKKIYLIHDQGY